jgi:signal transduction histidine kinase
MGSPLERRRSQGRRRSDDRDILALRGVLHDVGHELTTLSYLVEAVRGDTHLPEDSSYRLELLSLEMDRLQEIIRLGLDGLEMDTTAEPVKLRELATQLTQLADMAFEAEVTLVPGPDVSSAIHPLLLWRVLSNVVDNAARAAGAGGTVTVAIGEDPTPVIDVSDSGPGFGAGPPGQASLGLNVVMSLLEACGGSLTVTSPSSGGTVVRLRLPAQAGVPAGMGG